MTEKIINLNDILCKYVHTYMIVSSLHQKHTVQKAEGNDKHFSRFELITKVILCY